MKSDVHILIVDDSQAIRDFVIQALGSQEGFTVLEARDGAEGLEMALADPPDLMLLDYEMPRLSGLQVVEALRERQADIPVILITSHGSEAIAVELFRKGVKDYMNKPFTAEEMMDAIERALTEVRLRREKEALTQRLTASNRQLQRRVQEMDILYRVGKSVTSLLSREQLVACGPKFTASGCPASCKKLPAAASRNWRTTRPAKERLPPPALCSRRRSK